VYSLPEIKLNRCWVTAVVVGTSVGSPVLHYEFLTQLHSYMTLFGFPAWNVG
jgi:hypothetical protein